MKVSIVGPQRAFVNLVCKQLITGKWYQDRSFELLRDPRPEHQNTLEKDSKLTSREQLYLESFIANDHIQRTFHRNNALCEQGLLDVLANGLRTIADSPHLSIDSFLANILLTNKYDLTIYIPDYTHRDHEYYEAAFALLNTSSKIIKADSLQIRIAAPKIDSIIRDHYNKIEERKRENSIQWLTVHGQNNPSRTSSNA